MPQSLLERLLTSVARAEHRAAVLSLPEGARLRAVLVVGQPGPEHIADLVLALASDHAEARRLASRHLGRQSGGDPGRAAACLADANPTVRAAAAEALAEIGAAALPAIEPLLDSPNADARHGAALALALLGRDAAKVVPAIANRLARGEENDATLLALMRAVGGMGARGRLASPHLGALLQHASEDVREAAARALGLVQVPAQDCVQWLTMAAGDASPRVRAVAARSLGAMGVASEALEALLEDKDPAVRVAACEGYAAVGKATAAIVTALAARMADEDAGVRLAALSAVGVLAGEPAQILPTLERAAREKDEVVRTRALEAIGCFADDALPVLDAMLHGDDDSLREPAARLMVDLPRGQEHLLMALTDKRAVRPALAALATMDAVIGLPLEPFRAMLLAPGVSAEERRLCARILAGADDEGAQMLLKALGSPNGECVAAALDAIGNSALTAEALSGPLAEALARAREASLAAKAIRTEAADGPAAIPHETLSKGAELGDDAREALLQRVAQHHAEEPHFDAAIHAARAAESAALRAAAARAAAARARRGAEEFEAVALAHLDDADPSVRIASAAVFALEEKHRAAAHRALAAALRDAAEPDARTAAAAFAAAPIDDADAAKSLAALLADTAAPSHRRRAAAEGLAHAKAAPEETLAAILSAIDSEDAALRRAAREALLAQVRG